MDPLTSTGFWRRVDAHIDRRTQRVARAVRGLLVSAAGTSLRLAGTVAARAGEVLPDIEIMQHYGFASVPLPGTEVVTVPIGGASAHRVVVAELDPATRPTDLVAGDAVIYTAAGNRVRALLDGSVEISTPAAGVVVQITVGGQVLLAGGGPAVARVGDAVTIVGTDSLGGPITIASAVIAAGSTLVQAGG